MENDAVDPKYKEVIDKMSYRSLLKRWRHGKDGDPMFQGATGDYYAEAMDREKDKLTPEERIAISKEVGLE